MNGATEKRLQQIFGVCPSDPSKGGSQARLPKRVLSKGNSQASFGSSCSGSAWSLRLHSNRLAAKRETVLHHELLLAQMTQGSAWASWLITSLLFHSAFGRDKKKDYKGKNQIGPSSRYPQKSLDQVGALKYLYLLQQEFHFKESFLKKQYKIKEMIYAQICLLMNYFGIGKNLESLQISNNRKMIRWITIHQFKNTIQSFNMFLKRL